MRKTLQTGTVTWSYLDSEIGNEVWLTFHGYGQEAEIMQHFVKSLRPNARVLSFDLPLHGNTRVKTKKALAVGDLAELLGKALQETEAKSCSVLGFSLGGKLALKMVELAPVKMERIVLIAPDGLKTNPLYWFVTHTIVGRWIFELVIRFPQPLLGASWLLATLRVMDPKIHAFVAGQMGTREKRQKVLDTWMMFRHIKPPLDQVRKKIWRYRLKPTLVFGKRDRVIHPRLAKKLSGDNCKSAKLIMLDAGHNLTTKQIAEEIKNEIQ